jgi:hypothetical protein
LFDSGIGKVFRGPIEDMDRPHTVCRFLESFENLRGIITINYDRVGETALDALNIAWIHSGIRRDRPYSDEEVEVVKLHGDSLWEQEEPRGLGEDEDGRPTLKRIGMLPFSWIRDRPTPEIGFLWNRALGLMSSATQIVFAGVGLPTTDQHLAHFIASGFDPPFEKTVPTSRISIVNPDPEAIARTVRAIPPHWRRYITVNVATLKEYAERT